MDSRENKHLNILVDNEVTKEQIYELSYLNYNGVYVRVDVYDDSEYLISYNNVQEGSDSMVLYPGIVHDELFDQSMEGSLEYFKIRISQFQGNIVISIGFGYQYDLESNVDIRICVGDMLSSCDVQVNQEYYRIRDKGRNFMQIEVDYEMVKSQDIVGIMMRSKIVCGSNSFWIVASSTIIVQINHNSNLVIYHPNQTLYTSLPDEGVFKVKLISCKSQMDFHVSQVHPQTNSSNHDRLKPIYKYNQNSGVNCKYYKVNKGDISVDFELSEEVGEGERISSKGEIVSSKGGIVSSKVETEYMSLDEFNSRDDIDHRDSRVQIDLEYLKNGVTDLQIRLNRLVCRECKQNYMVEYQVMISGDQGLLEQQKMCFEQYYDQNVIMKYNLEKGSLMNVGMYQQTDNMDQQSDILDGRIQIDKQYSKIYVVVVAVVYNEQQSVDGVYFYHTQEVLVDKIGGYLKWWMVGLFSILVFWYLRRQKMMKEVMEQEVEGVMEQEVEGVMETGQLVQNDDQDSYMISIHQYQDRL